MSDKYKNKKVLVVDDTAFMRNNLINILDELGFGIGFIDQAVNGKEALEFLAKSNSEKAQPYDLIFCDWNMPIMTGIELLKAVRRSEQYFKTIPFILVTTDSEKDKVLEAVQYKVSNYIIKPVEKDDIEHCLNSIGF
mgnify:CR=1 FL=1|tara:strand:- start:1629 stop:2039 length:411 start_codon:yes stop_codon:yes gene_type:complete